MLKLIWFNPGLMLVFYVVRMVCDVFDHVFQDIVAREHGVELALTIVILKN